MQILLDIKVHANFTMISKYTTVFSVIQKFFYDIEVHNSFSITINADEIVLMI